MMIQIIYMSNEYLDVEYSSVILILSSAADSFCLFAIWNKPPFPEAVLFVVLFSSDTLGCC